MTCGYTQSTKFFGTESHETISDSIVNFYKKNKFGLLIGFGSTFWSLKDFDIYDNRNLNDSTGENDFLRGSSINSLPNFNLIFIKNFKKNMLFISPGIRTISAKLRSTIPFYKDLEVNQVQIELPIIYNINLNKNISMNFGISPKGSIWGNFLGYYNYKSAYLRYSEEGLIHKEKSPSGSYSLVSSDYFNLSSDETAHQIFLDKPDLDENGFPQLFELSLISGIDLLLDKKNRLNKKNRINLSYRIDLKRSTHTVLELSNSPNVWDYYYDSYVTSSNLQYFEINYIHLF